MDIEAGTVPQVGEVPQALPLVFTRHSSRYIEDFSCIFNNDSFTEILNEDFDSYVITPWSWNSNYNAATGKIALIPIALITLVTNVLVIATFVREKMMSALNVILIGISVSDTLTVLIPTIATLFMYLDGVFPDYIAFEYCQLWAYLTKYLPTITHNASLWLTLVLAYDRYIAIRYPFLVRRLCLPRTSVTIILVVYTLATMAHVCRFVDTEYVPVKVIPAKNQSFEIESVLFYYSNSSTNISLYTNSTWENVTGTSSDVNNVTATAVTFKSLCDAAVGIRTCRAVYSSFFAKFKYYEFCYYWFVILFVKLLPCVSLIVLDTLMLKALRHAERIRHVISAKALNSAKPPSQSRNKYRESRRMTIIVIIAVVIVIIVELPIGLILVFWTLAEIHDHHFITERTLSVVSRTANSIAYVSYPVIFVLYCCISAKFRRAFCRLCTCGGRRCARFSIENEYSS